MTGVVTPLRRYGPAVFAESFSDQLIAAAEEVGNPLKAWVRSLIKRNPAMLIPAVLPGGTWKGRRYTVRVGGGRDHTIEAVINSGGQGWSITSTGERANGLIELVARLEGCTLAEATMAALERSLRHIAAWSMEKRARRQRSALRAAA
jgi:hypothetical protein